MFAWSALEHGVLTQMCIIDSAYFYTDSQAHLTAIGGAVFRGFSTDHMGKGNIEMVENWFSLKDI